MKIEGVFDIHVRCRFEPKPHYINKLDRAIPPSPFDADFSIPTNEMAALGSTLGCFLDQPRAAQSQNATGGA